MIKVVNTGSFWSDLPNKVSVAISQPKGGTLPVVTLLKPEWGNVKQFKDSAQTPEDWEIYDHNYYQNLSATLFYERGQGNLSGDAPDIPELIQDVLEKEAAKLGGVEEITICCWEKEDNPYCHRKILYDLLPKEIRGVCK